MLPQVVYPHEVNAYPQWIAPLGDVLRAARLLAVHEHDGRLAALQNTLLVGQLSSGGLATARGFGAQMKQRQRGRRLPDFRNNLPVAGWADKAFRYLAGELPVGTTLPLAALATHETLCAVKGRQATWLETEEEMTLAVGKHTLYRWQKGQSWAGTVTPEIMWK